MLVKGTQKCLSKVVVLNIEEDLNFESPNDPAKGLHFLKAYESSFVPEIVQL